MLSNYYLFGAIREYEKKKRRPFDIYGSDYFSKVMREYASALTGWPSDIQGLIAPENWNTDRLLQHDALLRKPRVWLSVDITQKENLVLDWYPGDRFDLRAGNDFKYWNNQWSFGSEPFNRIVMIREFGYLSSRIRQGETGKAEHLLVEGILALLDHIADFTLHFCEVSKRRWLFLEYDSRKSSASESHQLQSCTIKNVAEEKAREEAERKTRWLKEQFQDGLRVEVSNFLRAFQDAGGNFRQTRSVLRTQYGIEPAVSLAKIKMLVSRLYEQYPDLYDKYCSVVPRGVTERQKAKIIPFTRN